MEKVKEDTTNGEDVDTDVDVEDTTENQPSMETLTVQKKKALEQRDEARAKVTELEAKLAEGSKENKSAQTNDTMDDNLSKRVDKLAFAQSNPNLSPAVIEEIADFAYGLGITIEEATQKRAIQSLIKDELEQKSLNDASPDGSRSPKTKTEKPTSEMTRDEHKAWAIKNFGLK